MKKILLFLLLLPCLAFGAQNTTISGKTLSRVYINKDIPQVSYFYVRDNANAKLDETPYYNTLTGVSCTETTNQSRIQNVMPCNGTFKRFRIAYDGPTFTGNQSIDYSLMVNSNAYLLATIDSGGKLKYNNTMAIPVVKGDAVCYKLVLHNTPNNEHYWATIEFENNDSMVILGNNRAAYDMSITTRYTQMQGSPSAWSGTGSAFDCYFPTSGKIQNFYVHLSDAPGSGNSVKVILYNVSTVKGALWINDTSTTGEWIGNISVNQGYSMRIGFLNDTSSSVPSPAFASYGATFTPSIRGEFPVMLTEPTSINNTSVSYDYTQGPKFWLDTYIQRTSPFKQGNIIKKWGAWVDIAPGTNKSKEFTLVNLTGNSIGLTANITNASLSAIDNSGAIYVTQEGDEYAIKSTPAGTPASSKVYTSFVLYNSGLGD